MRHSRVPWLTWCVFGIEANMVIAMRLAKIARGGAAADAEASRMVTEKILAGISAQHQVVKSFMSGRGRHAQSKATQLYRRRVRANLRRLAKGK
jgi:hypothetical protein